MFIALAALAPLFVSDEAIDKQYDVELNGAHLHFHVRGKDPANPYVVFLHGGPGFSSEPFMATLGAELEPDLNVVYLDQRGCGLSDRLGVGDMKHCTMDNLVKDIDTVRQHLGVKRWGVIGHSFGGTLAVKYISRYPQDVTFFIGLSPIVSVPMMTEDILNNSEEKFKQWKVIGSESEKSMSRRLLDLVADLKKMPQTDPRRLAAAYSLALNEASLYFADPKSPAMQLELKKMQTLLEKYNIDPAKLNLAPEPSRALVTNDNYMEMDVSTDLAKVRVPTLLIGGRSDGVVTVRHLEIARRGIEGAHLVLLDDCGHFPFYEQPTKLLGEVLRFLRTLR